jgi:hypothetical protein
MLSYFYDDRPYTNIVEQMLCNVKDQMSGAGPFVANWISVLYQKLFGSFIATIPIDILNKTIMHGTNNFTPNLIFFPRPVSSQSIGIINIPQDELEKLNFDPALVVKYAEEHKHVIS